MFPGPDTGRLPGLLAADGVRPIGPSQPRLPAGRSRLAVPLLLLEQQPGHERPPEALWLADVLRPRHRPGRLFVLLAGHSATLAGDCGGVSPRDECLAGCFDGRLRPAPLLPRN